MKNFLKVLLAISLPALALAQSAVINTGVTVTIETGLTVTLQDSLTNEAAGTINNYGTIQDARNWNNQGTFNDTGTVTFNGSSAQTIRGASTFNFMTINNTAGGVAIQTGAQQKVRNTLILTNGLLTIPAGDSLILISDATRTARIAQVTSGTFSGNITMQRYIGTTASPDHWKILSSACSGRTLQDWNRWLPTSGFTGSDFPGSSFVSIKTYDETNLGGINLGWVPATNTTNTIDSGKGYWVFIDKDTLPVTINMTGQPNIVTGTDSVTFPVTFTNSPQPDAEDGWNMVGNPFPSTIDWDAAAGWRKTNLSATFWNRKDDKSYASWPTGGPGVNGGTRYIASSQGFWVQTTATGDLALKCNEDVKVSDDATFFKQKESIYPFFKLLVHDPQYNYKDEAVVRFVQGSSYSRDPYDASKLKNEGNNPNISIIVDSMDMVVNSIDGYNQDYLVRVRVKYNWTYKIYANSFSGLPATACILLEDLQTGNIINLLTDTITKTINKTDTLPMFKLRFSPPVLSPISGLSCYGDNNAALTVKGHDSTWSYTWVNLVTGDTITKTGMNSADTLKGLSAGFYALQLSNSGKCGVVSENITIDQPVILLTNTVKTNTNCFGSTDGKAAVAVTGGSSPYSYLWDDPASTAIAIAFNLPAGLYRVTITDKNGCTRVDSTTVNEPAQITTTINKTNVSCYGLSDGSAVLNMSNGVTPLQYLWSNGAVSAPLSGIASGIYKVSITDANGCTKNDSIVISEPAAVVAAFTSDKDTAFIPSGGGTVAVQFSNNSTGAASYQWDFGDGISGNDIAPAHSYSAAASYYVVLMAQNGICKNVTARQIIVQKATSFKEISGNDGTINIYSDNKKVFINFNLDKANDVFISVFNILGEVVTDPAKYYVYRNQVLVDLTGVSTGIYFVKIILKDKVFTEKVVIIK